MDLRQLEMFQAVAEAESFTRAGERLHVSQSAVSRQIKLLEEELGDQVFKRISKRVYLTRTGEILLQHTRRIFGEVRQLETEISDLTRLTKGPLRIGGGMSVCTYLFPALLKQYHTLHPGIELMIVTGTNEEILRALRHNEVDLTLLSLPFGDADLEVIPAVTEELVLVAEPRHPLMQTSSVKLKDLAAYPFIHFEKGSNTRRTIDDILRKAGVRLSSMMELQNVEIIKALVAHGLGISVIPLAAALREGQELSLRYRRFAERRIYRELGWVSLKSDYKSNAREQLIDLFEAMRDRFRPAARVST